MLQLCENRAQMNEKSYEAAAGLVSKTYVDQGRDARKTHEKHIQVLLQQRKLPDDGWSNTRIELLLQELALMDSNNFPGNVGVGEREARIASELVAQRHYRLGHGIGRSGDITAVQPKAAGSSIMAQLTNSMLLDIVRHSGVHAVQKCVLIPVATGMGLLLVLLTIKQQRPKARYVVWPRIDQKSCFKCMVSAAQSGRWVRSLSHVPTKGDGRRVVKVQATNEGFDPVVVENILEGDELRTNVPSIEEKVHELGAENIACVLTTTSCFAPRGIDMIPEVSQLCKRYEIPHIVNNAYGVQSTKCMHYIQEGHRLGRVDAFVQSTDKNFMVPVGGCVVASSNAEFIKDVAQIYPGRASATPTLDVFITLLSLGCKGYRQLCVERKENWLYLKSKLEEVASKHGERVLQTPKNPISIAVSLSSLPDCEVDWTEFGSMLFTKHVSGTRVVVPGSKKTIGPHTFDNWGSHFDGYPCAYFTAAAAVGMKKEDVDTFAKKLDKVFTKFKRKRGHVRLPVQDHSSNGSVSEQEVSAASKNLSELS